jgi:hypothetical protein
MSFMRHGKIYQKGEVEPSPNLPDDHLFDESSAGYSFAGCSPAEPTSASPALHSFSLYYAAVQSSAVNRNCPSNFLSHQWGPLQVSCHRICPPDSEKGIFRMAPVDLCDANSAIHCK